jgi:hypothetical protein
MYLPQKERHSSVIWLYKRMNTIAIQRTDAKQQAASAHKRRKAKEAVGSSSVTEKLKQALDDVENDRFYTVDPNNYREGFKELVQKLKSA